MLLSHDVEDENNMRLRIVELCTDKLPCPYERGGAIESYVYGISRALSELGAEVHLITIERSNVDYGKVNVHVVDIKTPIAKNFHKLFSVINIENANVPFLTAKLLRIFNNIESSFGEIHVIHNHYFTTAFAPLLFNYGKSNIIRITHVHNELKPNVINKLLVRRYDAILAVSRYIKRSIIAKLMIDPSKVGVAYNAIDIGFFKPCNAEEFEESRLKFGIQNDLGSFIIAFVGRIVPEKGLHHLILASRILANKGFKFKVLLAGPLGHFDKMEIKGYPWMCLELINMLGLSKYIKYVGRLHRREIRYLYCASDLVIVPSIWEDPCPTVALEAMATGKPVVAYASGGIPEIIPPYGGVLVKEKSPRSLAEAIERVIEGSVPINRSTLIEWAHKFSYQAVAYRLKKIFTKMYEQTL